MQVHCLTGRRVPLGVTIDQVGTVARAERVDASCAAALDVRDFKIAQALKRATPDTAVGVERARRGTPYRNGPDPGVDERFGDNPRSACVHEGGFRKCSVNAW